mgnify:FL=1
MVSNTFYTICTIRIYYNKQMSNLNNTILELLKQGFTLEYIMKNLDVSYHHVEVVARRNNFQKRTIYMTWDQIEKENNKHNAR